MKSLRLAGTGGLVFLLLFVIHRTLQGTGPTPSQAGAYYVQHRAALQASEVAVGLALVAFIGFLAGLVPVIWRAGAEAASIAVLVSGAIFVATGLLSNAAETALIAVARANEPGATAALFELQGRTPIVLTIAALAASVSFAVRQSGLLWPWFAAAGFVASAIFALGFVFSVFGDAPEGPSSLYGVGLFMLWMLVLCVGLLRAPTPPPSSAAARA